MRIYNNGAELQNTAQYFFGNTLNGPTLETTTVRSGAASWKYISSFGNSTETSSLTATEDAMFSRIAVNFSAFPSSGSGAILWHTSNGAGAVIGSVNITSTGVLQLKDGGNGASQIGSNSATLSLNTWYIVELMTDNGGSPEIAARLNLSIFASGSMTAAFDAGKVGFGISTGSGTVFIDDVAVNSGNNSGVTGGSSAANSWVGDSKLILVRPNAAGDSNLFATQVGGTAGSANNYTRVNETTPDDATSYNGSNTNADEDMFNVDNTSIGTNDTINVVSLYARRRESAAGTGPQFRLQVKKTSGGTVGVPYPSGTVNTTTSTTWATIGYGSQDTYNHSFYNDPDGSSWSKSEIDSMQIGYKLNTGTTNRADFSAVWAYVDYNVWIPHVNHTTDALKRKASTVTHTTDAAISAQAQAGKTTDGAGNSASSLDKMFVSQFTVSTSGTIRAGASRVWLSSAGTGPSKFVVYADSAGAPGALLASSDQISITNTAEAEIQYPFSGAQRIKVNSGSTVWLGVAWQDPGTPSFTVSRDNTASLRQEQVLTYPTLPDPFGTPNATNSGPIDAYLMMVLVPNSTKTHTTDANKKKATTATHTTDSLKRKANTVSHTTDANKKKSTTVSHTTDANKKKSGNTVSHTTDALKRKQFTVTHTTDANKKKTSTVTHTTDSNKKKSGNTRTHTTDANKKKSGNTVTHTTDSLKRKQFTATHTTDANKKKAGNTRTHTTDSLLRKVNTRTHTTDAFKRIRTTVSHTTDAYTYKNAQTLSVDYFGFSFGTASYTKTHTTDALKRKTNTLTHTTDALKRTANTRTHTTDANKRKVTLVSHTADANKRKALSATHTTDALKRTINLKTHTTDALKRKQFTLSHTTDSFLRRQITKTHTTDANKRKATLVSHTTDANKKVANNLRTHTTDALKRKLFTKTHTTDALLRRQLTLTHTTDALKRKANIKTHTTDANKRKATLVSHTTDANKRASGLTRTHTTDALKRKQSLLTHSTNANKRKSGNTVSHTTDAYLVDRRTYSMTSALSLPTTSATLATLYTAPQVVITQDDDSVYVDEVGPNILLHEFEYRHTNNTDAPTFHWNGRSTTDAASSTIYLQIWNENGSVWETLDTDNTTVAGTDLDLYGTQNLNTTYYYGTGNRLVFRVYQS